MIPPDQAPERTDEAPAQRVRERRWLPLILVSALILVVSGGARTAAQVTAGTPGPPVTVGGDVRIQPLAGWDLEQSDDDGARFHRGPVLLDVFVGPPDPQGAASLAQRYVDSGLRASLAHVSVGEPGTTTIAGGVPAVRFGYVGITTDGVPIEGVVVAANGAHGAAVFDAYAPQGALATVADDLRTMIDTAAVS